MRKTYKMLMTLALMVLGASSVSAQYTAELDPAMFKAWDSPEPGAQVVTEPEQVDGNNFVAENRMYEDCESGATIYGSNKVYYLWYADLTGTKTISFEGTAGMILRVLINRPAPEDGATDQHGGATVEIRATLDEAGKAVVDLSQYEYVHLNALKVASGSKGRLTKAELNGAVKPTTGWVSLIENGNMEGDDVTNFVVALKASTHDSYEPCVITDGVGKDGSRGIKITSDDQTSAEKPNSWETQFFVKLNEPVTEDTKVRFSMDYRADAPAEIYTGCHGEPRKWHSGGLFPEFPFTTEWEHYEWEGLVTAENAGADGLGSIAFDLNRTAASTNYYFDNITFEMYKESTPISLIKPAYGNDVICVDFAKPTNIAALVKAGNGKRLMFPKELAKVTVNGEPTTLLSVEGRPDGKLWIFVYEGYSENEDDEVLVSFTNPEGDQQISFTQGKFEGQPIPSFTDLKCEFNYELGYEYSFMFEAPELVSADPEDGEFNLPLDMKEFKLTFDKPVNCAVIDATLGKEVLKVLPAEGFSEEITLVREGGDLNKGEHILNVTNVYGEYVLDDSMFGELTLTLNFGQQEIDPNDVVKELLPDYIAEAANGTIPEGYFVNFNGEERTPGNSYGSGPRMFSFGDNGDFKRALYWREGYVEYGGTEGYNLELEAGKKYSIHFNTAMWKSNGTWAKFEILDEAEEVMESVMVENAPNVNGNTTDPVLNSTSTDVKFNPSTTGNYRLRWTSTNASGEQIYSEVLLANVGVKYLPNNAGAEEIALLETALENAKTTLEGNGNERYAGAAYDALKAAIEKYDGKSFTKPSTYREGAAELDAAAAALKEHVSKCNTYDPLPAQAQELADLYADTKYAVTKQYETLAAVAKKYVEVKTGKNDEEEEYTYYVGRLITDDAELDVAIAELQKSINTGKQYFTEGVSKTGGGTGIAVLTERLRLGMETAYALGAEGDEEPIIAAEQALSDDDRVAEALKLLIKKLLYGQLKESDNSLFAPYEDEMSGEMVTPTIDMTVFVKNPNLYITKADRNDRTTDNAPGWIFAEGSQGSWTTGWSQIGDDEIPADAMYNNWESPFTITQEILDLPAGVFNVYCGYGERSSDEVKEDQTRDGYPENSHFIYKTSSMEAEDSIQVGVTNQDFITVINSETDRARCPKAEGLVITDGYLKLGVTCKGTRTHIFWNDVKVEMVAAANGFDYAAAYNNNEQEVLGVDQVAAVKVLGIALYDLNGQRISNARKGIVLVKKYMSDGTVRTEKVIKK